MVHGSPIPKCELSFNKPPGTLLSGQSCRFSKPSYRRRLWAGRNGGPERFHQNSLRVLRGQSRVGVVVGLSRRSGCGPHTGPLCGPCTAPLRRDSVACRGFRPSTLRCPSPRGWRGCPSGRCRPRKSHRGIVVRITEVGARDDVLIVGSRVPVAKAGAVDLRVRRRASAAVPRPRGVSTGDWLRRPPIRCGAVPGSIHREGGSSF